MIQGGALFSLNASLTTGKFQVAGVQIGDNATGTKLSLSYVASTSSLNITGNTTIAFNSGSSVALSLGSPTDTTVPGLVIQGGVVTSVNASAKGTFSVFGLNATPNLTVVYQAAQGSIPSSLDLYGSLSLTNSEWGTNLDAILGNATNHGMSIQNGVLSSLNVGLTGSFSLAKVTFTANSLQVIYDQANNDLTVSGGASVSIGLGNRFSVSFPNNGLTISIRATATSSSTAWP